MTIRLALIALAFALGGCVNLGQESGPGVVYYVLEDGVRAAASAQPGDAVPPPDAPPQAGVPTLAVLDTRTSGFYDGDAIVFARSADTRGQYQFARWTERPGRRLSELLRARLERTGRYRVVPGGGYVRARFALDTRLLEFYHDAASQPGKVRLALRAELIDLDTRTLLGRRTFEEQVPVQTYDAAGAAAASSVAAGRLLDDLDAWLARLR
ncbi:ABC-type transport auxiliary lipoprotein family protein [Thiobacillus sedimenti]|uniref:ABC-type transport auxiliary lipoprotein family protein n=1 Tax=Thiobacillus sedimenti TaxID=3110231 RepID=A0ABZ1CKP3_9PROT|nr:ABC-type transport auxiliary lipoprotein family protein [Thiobacillus sp. SCUT-2]WRS39578.1 ABC-type transport auxiliary lipoprotein family protein [Thiobacillus sp. SCUT-2]